MLIGKLSLGLAAVALMAAPVLAQSTLVPAVEPLAGDEAGQSSETVVIGVVVAAAVVGGIIILSDGDDPLSP
jgi:hypothetical protein